MQEEKLGKKALYHITINDASNKPRGLKKKKMKILGEEH